jgi:hypothetical protein
MMIVVESRQQAAPRSRRKSGAEGPAAAAVFTLVECPELTKGTRYRLVRIAPETGETVLAEERARNDAPSLNLARIRHLGASMGATHVAVLGRR